jgi:UDP-N-acetylglucosamine diphosphorylase / glucose-1-phosphate thymidylyltransferase / UDP-N-acetylgalactosamine diphosphorylase / glucosamine-1-phosphate N-acetyltransferase / galactosamine-1-phosphate N-acetyltransferase
MQAVILCAGKSTRTYPLTLTKPKPLLKILNKTILEHNLNALLGIVEEVIIIVGYKKEMIIKTIGDNYKGIKIKYIEQKQQLGTGDAVLCTKDYIKDKFIVFGGDDIYSKEDIKNCIKEEYSILVSEVEYPEKFGIVDFKDNYLIKIEEKPKNPKSNLANTGLYVLDKTIFNFNVKKTERNEIEFTDFISELAKKEKIKIVKVNDFWIPVGYPWNYLEANVKFLKMSSEYKNNGKMEENVTIKGDVYIGEGSIIKANSYIEGPVYIGKNCEIGPFCHIRPDVVIEDNCRIGKNELFDCVIMQNTTSKHIAYIAHSVIGENVNIGAGLITADYRHDSKKHLTTINGNIVDSGRSKLGAFIGDNVKTGIGTLIYPGRKLWANTTTLPGEIVKKDKIE